MAIKIVIASKKNLVSEGFNAQLRAHSDFQVLGRAETMDQFNQLIDDHDPDVVVIGISFQEDNTGRFIKNFLEKNPNIKLVVSCYQVKQLANPDILESGATAFISPFYNDFEELIKAIHIAMSGQKYICTALQDLLNEPGYTVSHRAATQSLLSEREILVLQNIAEGRSSKEIARELAIAPSTVEVHRRNIMRKVGVHKATDLTRYAIRMNLVES